MKDLFLTPRGDLAIENISNQKKQLELNFITSKSNALQLNFFLEDSYYNKSTSTSLDLNFYIEKPEYDKDCKMITGDACIEQAIKIRVASALGSIEGNKDIGSKMELVIHELIDDNTTLLNLEKIIKESIKDLIVNPYVYIKKPASKYVDYSTNLIVYIIDKNRQFTINL